MEVREPVTRPSSTIVFPSRRLPAAQRVPIWLHYFEGFSVAEVARLEGAPEPTVRSRVRAGLRRLSLSLDDLLRRPEIEWVHPDIPADQL